MKAKTHKATAKRLTIKRKKSGITVMKRSEGQDHFNARQSGKTRRNKRSDVTVKNNFNYIISRALPNA